MSELEARKYISIYNLRAEIRQDMEDYQLLCSNDNNGDRYFPLLKERRDSDPIWYSLNIASKYTWFTDYLETQIHNNLSKLKELVEKNNE